jgi:hypothetical protein
MSKKRNKAKTIKLGLDVHLDRYVVVRLLDGGTPQPPQRFTPAEFMVWVAKQFMLAPEELPVGLGRLTSGLFDSVALWRK